MLLLLRRFKWFLVLLVVVLAGITECGRYSGGRSGGSSRPSTSYSRPASRPSPSSHPSPSSNYGWRTPSAPSPASRPSPSSSSGNIGWRSPSPPSSSPSRPSPSSSSGNAGWNTHNTAQSNVQHASRPSGPPYPPPPSSSSGAGKPPIGWNINNPPATQTHVSSNNAQKPNPSNIGWSPSTQTHVSNTNAQKPNPSNVGWNVGGATQTHVPSSNAQPNPSNIGWKYGSGGTQTHATNTHNQAPAIATHAKPVTSSNVGWNLPPRPGAASSHPVGPPVHSSGSNQYHYPQNQQPVYGGKTKVKVYNTVHNHYPGYYSPPQPSYHYPGYYSAPSYYHYGSSDTGSGALGFFLGYSLGRLTTPTYSHYSFYDGYRPRYDHYTVVHYHHNREQAPRDPVIQANAIVGCVGDTVTVCPAGTTSLCTSQGTLMCVVSAMSTVPCTDNRQVNCIKSTVPCVNSTIPGCENAQSNTTTVNIPCVSTAKVYGNITYVNNTIIIQNNTITNMTTSSNSTTLSAAPITTTSTAAPFNYTTKYPITTTPEPITTIPTRSKRAAGETPQDFCVAVIALPAQKKVTEGEELYNGTKDLVSKFLARVWGL